MNGFLRLVLVLTLAMTMVRCATDGVEDGDVSQNLGLPDQDFVDSDSAAAEKPPADNVTSLDEKSIEDELSQAGGGPAVAVQELPTELPEEKTPAETPAMDDEFAQFDKEPAQNLDAQFQTPPTIEPPPKEEPAPIAQDELPPPTVDIPPPVVQAVPMPEVAEQAPPPEPVQQLVNIKNIKYKANDNGGTVVVEADGPMSFETRSNSDTGQFIIEIPGAKLPRKLKRPFNTKDMKGGIGSIDTYQNKGSTTARIVVQLRQGASEPVVQSEGNSLLIVESGTAVAPSTEVAEATEPSAESHPEEQSKILSSQSLEEFLSGSSQFYGKKISLETSEMDIREVFKLIAEESGINMVLSDDIKGTLSLKLRQVPWDQAMVVIMKARKLGYTRAGNVLRIALLKDIQTEEAESITLATAKKAQTPLKVRLIPVSYAKIDDLINQVKPFLSDRGKVVGDNRTSSLVLTDIDENIERALKVISSIDVPPLQVLIEGKVVEASDRFQRQVGINWGAQGRPYALGTNGAGREVRGIGNVAVSPGVGASTLGINYTLGTLDILGDLSATLGLFEQQNLVKVLSAPRIMTLHNEPAEINQTTEIPIFTESITNGTVSRTPSFKPVKLKLSVTPQITNDAAVIMTVDVNRDFLGAIEDQKSGTRSVNSRSAKTKVMVKNGQTAVIGGIFQSDDNQGETKVPWVADIPLLGWLFKSKSWDKTKNELLIFLTPRIVGQADSQSISPEVNGGGNL